MLDRQATSNVDTADDLTACLDVAPVAQTYRERGWWSDRTIANVVAANSQQRPADIAFSAGSLTMTWAEYDAWADRLAALLVADQPDGAGLRVGDRLAIWLPDTPTVHVAYVAAERAGLVVVGLGARAGDAEVLHLLEQTRATALLTFRQQRNREPGALLAAHGRGSASPVRHLVVPELTRHGVDDAIVVEVDGAPVDVPGRDALRSVPSHPIGPDELWLINSTSGTTGMPKCVVHTQNRWSYFHQLAARAAGLHRDDVFLSALPSPFGFGIWTAHVSPTLLGVPCVLLERFSADACLEALERHRVTVLACVSTQFIMMLHAKRMATTDLSSLRAVFTGGEAVPFEQASAFEEATSSVLLQFYGSNETGALSYTSLADTRDRRLRTAGRIIPEMQVRLYSEVGDEVALPGRGIPAARGPATCLGYFGDEEANRSLFTDDGWMRMGDVVEIDADGYLTVVGRTSDIIIRGGKNISAATVEQQVMAHPSVSLAAAVAMPDPVFGERVCVYAELQAGSSLTLEQLVSFLRASGTSSEYLPEHLVVVDELPRSSGRKVAKGLLREDVRTRGAGGDAARATDRPLTTDHA